ncbi:MAG: hypothetical protein AABX82_02765 [Nanoarchaeota archaeon]
MTETTIEKAPIPAADIAIIVESAVKEKTPRLAPLIEVKPLIAKEYVDPQNQEYIVEKQNRIGTGLDRNTDEGRSVIHRTIHLMGDQAEY